MLRFAKRREKINFVLTALHTLASVKGKDGGLLGEEGIGCVPSIWHSPFPFILESSFSICQYSVRLFGMPWAIVYIPSRFSMKLTRDAPGRGILHPSCVLTCSLSTGLLRPLSVSLRTRTPQLCHFSGRIVAPIVHNTAACAARAPVLLHQAPRWSILERYMLVLMAHTRTVVMMGGVIIVNNPSTWWNHASISQGSSINDDLDVPLLLSGRFLDDPRSNFNNSI